MTEPIVPTSAAMAAAGAEKRYDDVKPNEVAVKKARLDTRDHDDNENKLETRLGGILCCAVCLDLPRSAVYQVSALSDMATLPTHSISPFSDQHLVSLASSLYCTSNRVI